MIALFGVAAAGRASARLLEVSGVGVSRDTVLRVVMALPVPFEQAQAAGEPVPVVLGVDDVAIRRGHSYATIIIDADTHQPLDLLPDRLSGTLATWLRAHPGIQIVCRYGSSAYAEAIRAGGPRAVQVNDRWHFWHGLGEAVEEIVLAHAACWRPTAGRTLKLAPGSDVWSVRSIDERPLTGTGWFMTSSPRAQGLSLMETRRRLG